MSSKSREERVVGDVHTPSTGSHSGPLNQQVWDQGGKQVGSIEIGGNSSTGDASLELYNKRGEKVTDL